MKRHLRISLGRISAQVCWEAAPVGDALQDILRYFGVATVAPDAAEAGEGAGGFSAPAVALCFSSSGSLSVPEEAEEATHFDGGITAWRAEERVFLTAGPATLRLDPAAGTGEGEVETLVQKEPGALREEGGSRRKLAGLLVLGLFILLRPHAYYPLHAAALAGGEGAGVLFIGASGAGKSTMAYSLVRQGWAYLSDDSVLLTPCTSEAESDVEALPFRCKFGLEAAAEGVFPELAAAWGPRLADGKKRSLDVGALAPGQAAERCVPRVLVFPEITGQPRTQLRPVSKSEAMHAAVGQSALVTLEPRRAPQHLNVLRRLVRQAPSYRLLAGHDLKADPPRVAALMASLLREAHSANRL